MHSQRDLAFRRPQDYAEGILEVCRQAVGGRLACAAGMSGSNLHARVEAIMRKEIGRPMTPTRRIVLAAAVIAAVGGPVAGGALTLQSQVVAPPAIAFESASVQPGGTVGGVGAPLSHGGPVEFGMEVHLLKNALSGPREGRSRFGGSLQLLVQGAYNVTHVQVEGGPSWVYSDRYAAALEEQLGLSLVAVEAPIEVLVIDRAEQPSAN